MNLEPAVLVAQIILSSQPWLSVNDGVMGGVSSSQITEKEGLLRFEGELSLDNNGGFASVRRLLEMDLSKSSAVRLVVRGDGRTYQLRFRQDSRYDGVAWSAPFGTNKEWQTVELSFAEFEPVFRGRSVPQAGPLKAEGIRQMGFMLADGTPGAFELEIKYIAFVE